MPPLLGSAGATTVCFLLFIGATGKIRADSSLRMVARRDGRPYSCQRIDPRRHDGHRRRVT